MLSCSVLLPSVNGLFTSDISASPFIICYHLRVGNPQPLDYKIIKDQNMLKKNDQIQRKQKLSDLQCEKQTH